MYYELYIDVLFLINFMMDSLLLMAVKKVLRCPVKNGRVFVGSGLGAVLTCVLVALPLPAAVKLPAYYAGIPGMMIRAGLDIRKGRQFWKAFGLLYVSAFLMGGMLQILRPWVRTGSIFFASAVPIYYLMYGIWRFLTMLRKQEERLCEVVLYIGPETYRMHALLDTGNGLTDPISGDPVSVIDPACAQKMLEKERTDTGVRYIPYRTVGGEGVMPVFRAEQMEVFLPGEKGEFRMRRPIIGICEGQISGHEEYQMILNPNVLAG